MEFAMKDLTYPPDLDLLRRAGIGLFPAGLTPRELEVWYFRVVAPRVMPPLGSLAFIDLYHSIGRPVPTSQCLSSLFQVCCVLLC